MRFVLHPPVPDAPDGASSASHAPQTIVLESLKGFEAFGAVFQTGTRFAHRGFTGFVRFRSEPTAIESMEMERTEMKQREIGQATTTNTIKSFSIHFGVTAKKRTRPAVLRNRIKRLLRESLRAAILLHPQAAQAIEAIVLVCNAVPDKPQLLPLENVLAPVERIIKDAVKHHKRLQGQTATLGISLQGTVS